MDLKRWNDNRKSQAAVGGLVFLISLVVYFRSVAPTVSYWDCGEFISCARYLGVMHPPGAPLYLLISRILTMLPFFKNVGLRMNVFSVFISAATVYLTFLIIVQLVRRWRGEVKSWEDRLIVYGSGAFGALAFAFTDSQWFNAVEAEVYGFSMFFTALVVWLALFWGERSKRAGSLLLIFFVFYLFGLASGVHLLNILAYPFVLLIAFFHDNQTVKRLLLLIFLQAAVPVSLYILLYQFDPTKLRYTELMAHQAKAWSFFMWFGGFWILGTLVYTYLKDRDVFKVWWVIPVLVLLGYSTYLAIYIRAGLSPPINLNNPSNLQRMTDYLGRKQYGTYSQLLTFFHRQTDFWRYQVHMMYTRYFGWQFIGQGTTLDYRSRIVEIISLRGLYGLPFIVGLWGAVHHFFKDWKRAIAVLILFLLTGYAIIVYLNQSDPQPRERDYSYVGSFFAFALWVGIGMAGIFEWISEGLAQKRLLKYIVYGLAGILLFAAVPINLYAFNHKSHDRSGNYVASDYSYNILQSCEPDAILFTGGDNDTYPLWYLQEVEGIRTDVRVVCLALLNAHWYVRQLRDYEPKVPIHLRDDVIDTIQALAWEPRQVGIAVPEDVRRKELEKLRERFGSVDENQVPDTIQFTLKPTFPPENPRALRMQDLMVLRILQVNEWKRPVYFARTVALEDEIGLDEYLRLDGLALKVMPYPVAEIDPEILRTNLFNKYKYRGLDDPKVYFNTGEIELFLNSRQAFLQLVSYYIDHNQKKEAASVLNEMSRRIPEERIPYSHELFALSVAYSYLRAGLDSEYERHVTHVIPGRQLSRLGHLELARRYSGIFKDWSRAESHYEQLLRQNADDVDAYVGLVYLCKASGQYSRGIRLLEDWLGRQPQDTIARRELETFRKLAAQDSVSSDSVR